MSDGFEKKSKKKFGIIALILIIVIAAGVGGWFYLKSRHKPEKIFTKAIEDAFSMSEKASTNAVKVKLGITGEISGTRDAQLKMANSIIKDVKLDLTSEIDTKNNIINSNIVALYSGEEVINASAILQDNSMYIYLKDLYSKYIEIDSKYFEEEGIELGTVLEESDFPIDELTKDIEDILIESLKDKEFEQEKVELDGKKVQKTTVTYTAKEMAEIMLKVMKKVNKYEPSDELKELIDELEDDIDYVDEEEIFLDVSLYTTGSKNDIVKMEAVLYEEDYMAFVVECDKKSENETVLTLSVNEDDSDKEDAEEIATVTINEKDSNNGTISFVINADGTKVKINIDYSIELNAEVEKKNVSNSILVDEMDEEDFNEIKENIEKNPFLYEILKDELDYMFPSTEPVYYTPNVDYVLDTTND